MSSQFFFREKRKIHAYNEHVNGKRKTFPIPERHEQQTVWITQELWGDPDRSPVRVRFPLGGALFPKTRTANIPDFLMPRVDFVSHLCGQRDGLTG